jgi:hypothetical protein
MLRYVLYPLFGAGVIGAYAIAAATGTDVTSESTHRRSLPAGALDAPAYGAAPFIWYTGFHGPAAYRAPTYSSGSRSFGGGGVGGFGGGK